MKLPLLSFLCTLMACTTSTAQTLSTHTGSPLSANAAWQEEAREWVRHKQSAIRRLHENTFAAVSPANNICFRMTPSGYQVRNVNADGDSWMASLEVSSLNGKAWKRSAPASVTLAGEQLVYRFPNLAIEYNNEAKGLRQNFIVDRPAANGDRLSLTLHIESELQAAVEEEAKLSLLDGKGVAHLYYDELKVWDANNQLLPARMSIQGDELCLSVDDRAAVYPVTIDPLNHAPAWTDNGQGLIFPLLNDLSSPLLFGFSVSDAGDVNGDGYSDIIVGAPTYVDIINISGGTFNVATVGAAFIYYGSAAGLSATPREALQPTTQVGALFGFSVSGAGDLNGDGYADVVVGAPGDHVSLNVGAIPAATSVAAGKVYVYYGGPGTFDGDVNTEPLLSASFSLRQSDYPTLLTTPVNALYGMSVSNAGDVNGDGFGDLLVGSPAYLRLTPTQLRTGRTDVYYGSLTGLSATPNHVITGTVDKALFGFSVSTAGNVNGDLRAGRPVHDIIVGAPGDLTFLGAGHSYVFHGSASGITATSAAGANSTLGSGLLSTLFGYTVSEAGDVNGDGYGDVITGEPAALETVLTETVSVGAVKISYGSASGVSASGGTVINSPRRPSVLGLIRGNLLFGYNVGGGADLNCDGYADLIIGEPGGTALSLGSGLLNLVSTNAMAGQAYVFYGRSTGPANTPGYTFGETSAVSVANLLGLSVSPAGDYNGDGRSDLLIGAPNGTLNLAGGIIPAVNSALDILTVSSIGSAYAYSGCLSQSVLPVNVSNFKGIKRNDAVLLTWNMENLDPSSHYVVERGVNRQQFKSIGIVMSNNAAGLSSYQFNDKEPLEIGYYRLKSVAADGKTSYSEVIRIQFGKDNTVQLGVFPNPVTATGSLLLNGVATGTYELKVYDAVGTLKSAKQVVVSRATQKESLSRSALQAGVYFAKLVDAGGHVVGQAKFICQ